MRKIKQVKLEQKEASRGRWIENVETLEEWLSTNTYMITESLTYYRLIKKDNED